MRLGDDDHSGACELLELYVELHNESVGAAHDRTGELLVDGAELCVAGTGLSALRRYAMIEAFRGHELMLWKVGEAGKDGAFASYAWRDNPRLGGTIRIERRGDRIASLMLRPGYARTFAALSMAPPAMFDEGGPDAFAGD